MDWWSSILVCVISLTSAAGLMVWHTMAWRGHQTEQLDDRELQFRGGQHRRRMQTSAMLGILGVAILVGQWLTVWAESRLFAVIYWGCVLLLLLWMALLAVADIVATQHHFSRMRTDVLIERARLQAEIHRIQAAETNGKVKAPKREPYEGN